MVVLRAGAQRAGSTRLFNIVRLILEKEGVSKISCSWEDHKVVSRCDYELVKVHFPNEYLSTVADIVFMPLRPIVDMVKSAVNFGLVKNDGPDILRWAKKQIENEKYWAGIECQKMLISYNHIVNDPGIVIRNIYGMDPFDKFRNAEKDIILDLNKIGNYDGKGGRDPITLMHKNHIARHKIEIDEMLREKILCVANKKQ